MKCSVKNCYACTSKHVRVKHPEPKTEPSGITPSEAKRLEDQARWRVGYAMGKRTPRELSELRILEEERQKQKSQNKSSNSKNHKD